MLVWSCVIDVALSLTATTNITFAYPNKSMANLLQAYVDADTIHA